MSTWLYQIDPTSRLAATLFALTSATFCFALELEGRVVSVHDGDTITVLVAHRQTEIRIAEIDTPELDRPFGRRSREFLAAICAGRVATKN